MVEAVAAPGIPQAVAQSVGKGGEVCHSRDIQLQRHRLAAQSLDFRDDLGGLRCVAAIGHDDITAVAGDGKRGIAAQPTVAPVIKAILLMFSFLMLSG